MERIVDTVIGVVVAIGGSAALFIGANRWFDQTRSNWARFAGITGAVIGASLSGLLVGNRIIQWRTSAAEDATDLSWLLIPLIAIAMGAWGLLLGASEERTRRLAIGVGGGIVSAVLIGAFMRPAYYPAMQIVPLLAWPVGVGIVGAGIARLRSRDVVTGGVLGASIGWLAGAFLAPSLGGGTIAEAFMGLAIAGAGIGLWMALRPPADRASREQLQASSRAVIFVAPALIFIGATLVIPTIQTFILSFQDNRGAEFVGLDNYGDVFGSPDIFNVSNFGGIFTSNLFIWGVILGVLGFAFARYKGRAIGGGQDWSGLSAGPVALGTVLVATAIFTTLRGVIWNNLWWVFAVTVTASVLGLAIAVLADRAKGESVAKSLIFMPMAISFVGAGIIWRFMYLARPPVRDQTGVLNLLWVQLGKLSAGESTAKTLWMIGLALVIAGLAYLAWRGWRAEENGVAIGSGVTILPFAWLLWRFLGDGIGGVARDPETGNVVTDAAGEIVAQPVIFLQEQPWNTFFLIIVLIWIQTGFAMVVFSAAIKGVPTDLIEASKVDGATESETFWRVTIPQIAPTIGVVTTTLIVLVMKVFDIPKVMTNGQFGTNVLANEMWQKAFTELNVGAGAALAMILFFSVLPVMYYNIRRQREAV